MEALIFFSLIGFALWWFLYWKPQKAALELHSTAVSAKNAFERSVATLENDLSQAMTEFEVNAYRPFWEKIESIASLKRQIGGALATYSSMESQYSKKPLFVTNLPAIPPLDPIHVTKFHRLAAIAGELYRTAQRDFKFAAILEMWQNRQTLNVLVEEVQSTQAAIHEMHATVQSAHEQLAAAAERQLDVSQRQLNASHKMQETSDAANKEKIAALNAQLSAVKAVHSDVKLIRNKIVPDN